MKAKAYKVHYSTASKSTSAVLLVNEGETKEQVLALKDSDFKLGDNYSRIEQSREISLHELMVRDLSAVELIVLFRLANQ